MINKIISFLIGIALAVALSGPSFAYSHFPERPIRESDFLGLIDEQVFDNHINPEEIKGYISHFANNGGSYVKVPNGSVNGGSNSGTDGTHTSKWSYGAEGCFHYAMFVTTAIYDELGPALYLTEERGRISPEGLKAFIKQYAQAGEHIRIQNVHSLIFISADDTGLYTLDYNGSNRDPDLDFYSYKALADILNEIKQDFYIYDTNKSLNQNTLIGWQKIADKWYYLNSSGGLMTGWLKSSGKWYYLDSGGVMRRGWAKVNNKWYYLSSSGAMFTGWLKSSNTWYYMDSSGAMKNGWVKYSGSWYYMDASGAMITGWLSSKEGYYYMNSSGAMQTGWKLIGGSWYLFGSDGLMKTGWQKVGGMWYYLNSSGVMLKNSSVGGYILGPSGAML